MSDLLEVENLSAGYGSALAVRDIGFCVAAGEVLVVVGSNGAGKTTTLLALAGLLRPASGSVRLAGREIAGSPAHKVAGQGLCLVPDDRGLFPDLTVGEHLRMASRARPRARSEGPDDQADLFAAFPRLPELTRRRCGLLSGGEQQMLALAKTLLLAPQVLLVDELSLGLAPVIVQELLPMVRRFAERRGMAVVLVEQHYELALAIADRAVVLNHGSLALAGPARDVLADRVSLEEAYLGLG